MLTSDLIHGQNRKSNAGVKINQLTNHTNALRKEKNACVMVDGLFMELS